MPGMPYDYYTQPNFVKTMKLEEELEHTKQRLAEAEQSLYKLLKYTTDLEIRYNAAMGHETSIKCLANQRAQAMKTKVRGAHCN